MRLQWCVYVALHSCSGLYMAHRLLSLPQKDEMPLTCAEELTMEPLTSCSVVDLEQNRLLIALLEEHNARRTWRRSKQSKAPSIPEAENDRKILSFSGGCSLPHKPKKPQQQQQQHEAAVDVAVIVVATAGIMLDTPEQEAHSVQPGALAPSTTPADGLQC